MNSFIRNKHLSRTIWSIFGKRFFHGLDFSNVASLLSLNQPKISAREFCSIFKTIFVWNKCKNLFHLHQYPKYNFLTLDYMIHCFYLPLTFYVHKSLKRLPNCKTVCKNFGHTFSSMKCFDKSLRWLRLTMYRGN